jgi:hypothetical protein
MIQILAGNLRECRPRRYSRHESAQSPRLATPTLSHSHRVKVNSEGSDYLDLLAQKKYIVNRSLTECGAMRKYLCAAALAALFAMQSTASHAQQPSIGNATATKNDVTGSIGGATRKISPGTDVHSNEVVRTGNASVADLKFLDESTMNIGPITEITLDKFVYDPSGSAGSVVIEATRGAFRFVTGKQDHKAYQIKTPFGTLGIRG